MEESVASVVAMLPGMSAADAADILSAAAGIVKACARSNVADLRLAADAGLARAAVAALAAHPQHVGVACAGSILLALFVGTFWGWKS